MRRGLAVEGAAVIAGVLGGLAALALMGVYRSPKTGAPVSRAGAPYAVFWTLVIGARAAFSYGSAHWFTADVVSWAVANKVTEAAIVDGLILMAIVMVLVRTIGLGVRASRLPAAAPAPPSPHRRSSPQSRGRDTAPLLVILTGRGACVRDSGARACDSAF